MEAMESLLCTYCKEFLGGSARHTAVTHNIARTAIQIRTHSIYRVDFFAEWCGYVQVPAEQGGELAWWRCDFMHHSALPVHESIQRSCTFFVHRPCKAIAPQFLELAAQHPDVMFVKVDVDQCQDLAETYEVSAMPTFKFLKNKEVVDTVRGADASAIAACIKEHKIILQTVAFGGGSSAPSQDEPLQLNSEQIGAVLNFLHVAEMATHEQAAAALAEHGWKLQEAAAAFFTNVADARWQNLSSVAAAALAAGCSTDDDAAAEVKLQVRLGADGRDKHAVQLPGSATGKDLLDKLQQLLPAGEAFTTKVRVSAAKADFALGPGDMGCALPALGLSRRGLVHVIPTNDDPEHIKVLKKL